MWLFGSSYQDTRESHLHTLIFLIFPASLFSLAWLKVSLEVLNQSAATRVTSLGEQAHWIPRG